MKKPVHKHNCDCCIYLDTQEFPIISDEKSPVDLYVCKQMNMPTVIGRFGIDGDYLSGLSFVSNEVNEMKQPGSTLDKIDLIIKNEKQSLTTVILAHAAKLAVENNFLNDDFTYNEPITKNDKSKSPKLK